MTAVLWCAFAFDLVTGGRAQARLEADDSAAAGRAVEILRRHAVLMTGVAVPRGAGGGAAVRFEKSAFPGYEIRLEAGSATIAGDDPVRAAFDLLRGWGCRFGERAHVPKRAALPIRAGSWRRQRMLFREAKRFDASFPAEGIAVLGLAAYQRAQSAAARSIGRTVRVASTTFDDFLPVELFAAHPEWFALRDGERAARGNFDLTNADARAAYLDRVGAWLEAHPEVEVLGLWPEVTTVWDERALAVGAPEAYALLWREAAARFPARRFEILATGLTLKPPATGRVPANVEVRLRPGPDASGLQPLAGQPIEPVVRAWEARGAKLVLEIDGAPASWCGMPWPCHEAVRGNARRFAAAVLRGDRRDLATAWHHPGRPLTDYTDAGQRKRIERARKVASWGHPADAADLFVERAEGAGDGDAFRIASVERLYRLARKAEGEDARSAARDLYLGYAAVLRSLPAAHAATYRRYRGRAYRRLVERLVPGGVAHDVGPATVTEGFERVVVELPRLRLGIDRRTATVTSLQRKVAGKWSGELAGDDGHFFAVTALAAKVERSNGEVRVESPATGRLRVLLRGRLDRHGKTFETVLALGGDGRVRQTSSITAAGGIACGARWTRGPLDRWICPAYALEGRFGAQAGRARGLPLPPRSIVYARAGERGVGLALRVGDAPRTMATIVPDPAALVAADRGAKRLSVEWIVFHHTGELGR